MTKAEELSPDESHVERIDVALCFAAIFLLLMVLGACTVHDPHVRLLDAAVDARPDACIELDAGPDDCCRLLPDQDAVRACGAPPPGACGDVVCRLSDCSLLVLNVCGLMIDAGSRDGS